MSRALAFGLALAVATAGGCGGGQIAPKLFSSEWEDDGGASIEALRVRLGGARPESGADVAIGVTGRGDKIVGLPLAGGLKWTFAHALDARPIVTGKIVVGTGGREVFALDALTGRKLWARDTGGLELRGAGDDGVVTALTFTRASGVGSVLLAVVRDGRSVQQIETDKQLGAPAVVRGLAFVPWADQYVSVIDLSTGEEAARVTLREKTSHAFATGNALYFGEVGIVRFDHAIHLASKGQASHLALPKREMPGDPPLMLPGAQRLPVVANAKDRIRLFARGSGPEGALQFDSARYYGTYLKLVMGFDSGSGTIAWAHVQGASVLGGSAAKGGLVVCDERGKVTILDARNGAVAGEQDIAEPLESCVVQADGLPVSVTPSSERLVDQLTRAVETPDSELVAAQRMLLKDLAALKEEDATKALIELTTDPRTPPDLMSDARAMLATRRNGQRYMLEALAKKYDFIHDVLVPPPVAPIASALGAIDDGSTAGPLAAHLFEPADSDEDVKEVAAALLVIAGKEQLPALDRFFAMYRGSADNDDMTAAVVSAAQAIIRLDGERGKKSIAAAAKDEMTAPVVRERLEPLIAEEPIDGGAAAGAIDGGADAGAIGDADALRTNAHD